MSSWADHAIRQLEGWNMVKIRPKGNSMLPRIKSGQLVTLCPVTSDRAVITVGDIVLCKVHGQVYLHKVKARGADGRFLIANAKGRENGWTNIIYGYVTRVED